MNRHFLTLADYSTEALTELLALSASLKQLYKSGGADRCLTGKVMTMLFEKPSSRTRLSFETGMAQLGGSTIYVAAQDIGGLGVREPIRDLARVLNGYVDIVVARTFSHESQQELTHYATVPVINALSDLTHPCQAMADMLTIQEHCGRLEGVKLAYVGDGNNVARSLIHASVKLGIRFAMASPQGYGLSDEYLKPLGQLISAGQLSFGDDPLEAVREADIVYTDTWTSMGQETEKDKRINAFKGYEVTPAMMAKAAKNARFMHCLPAYRGLEVSDEVIESPASIVFDQAENRLHFQRALLKHLLG